MIRVMTINWTNTEGSTVEIIRCIEERLKNKCQFVHCFQVGEKKQDSDYKVASWNVTRGYYLLARLAGIKYGLGSIPTRKLLRYIKKNDPDIVHVHCPNFYNINLYMLFDFLKSNNIPTVITNHAEFFYTGNCAHALDCAQYKSGCKKCKRQFDAVHPYIINRTAYEWKKMKSSFEGTKRFFMTVVSEWQKERIESSPITKDLPVELIENGVDTDVFKRMKYEHLFNKGDYKHIVAHVTSDFTIKRDSMKGGYFICELADQMPDTLFLVMGNYNKKEKDFLPKNIRLIGSAKKEELVRYYNVAEVTVLTSKRETFGMACAESLCCGTPVAAFQAGGTESIAIPEWSRFVEFGDVKSLRDAVIELRDSKRSNAEQISAEAKRKYSEQFMVDKFYRLYLRMTCDQ